MTAPVVAIVGYSDSGKTRVATALVGILSGKGYRVAAVKHCHDGHEFAPPHKDTARLFAAGAATVIASSPGQLTTTQRVEGDTSLEKIVASLGDSYDLVIAEGFKGSTVPKVLVMGKEPVTPAPAGVIAVVSDTPGDQGVPSYTFTQIDALACYLERLVTTVLS